MKLAMALLAAAAIVTAIVGAFFLLGSPFKNNRGNGVDAPATHVVQRAVSESELDGMVLSLADFGSEYSDLELKSDSGPQGRTERINLLAGCNGQREQEVSVAIDRSGWVAGYDRSYSFDSSSFDELADGTGISVGTGIDLFADADGAQSYVELHRRVLQEAGSECEGMIISNVETFDVSGMDGAVGITATFSGSEVAFTLAAVRFSVAQVAAGVSLTRKGKGAVSEAEAAKLAHTVEGRIQQLLSSLPEAPPTTSPQVRQVSPSRIGAQSDSRRESAMLNDGQSE